jgi:hypothetical protein
LVVSLLVVCAGPGTVFVSVTVVVLGGAVTVFVGPVSFADLVVSVAPPADWTAVLTFVATVETACCTVPDPPDPQELRAQAINTPAMSASAIPTGRVLPVRLSSAGAKVCNARDTDRNVSESAVRSHHPLRMTHLTLVGLPSIAMGATG